MEMFRPVREAAIAGVPIGYEWNLEVSRAIRHPLDGEHARLVRAFKSMHPRAAFGLLIASAEWVAWRYHGLIAIDDALQRIEAGYAALVDASRARLPQPDEPFPKALPNAHGPLKLARMLIATGFEQYARGDAIVRAAAVSMALLARHVCPGTAFEAWLATAMRRCKHLLPGSAMASGEQPPLTRIFFEGADSDAGDEQAFIAALDTSRNPYLLSPAR